MYCIKHKDKLNSTNTFAKEHLEEFSHLDVISCDYQMEGHGQFDRKWYSSNNNGGNCYISIILKPTDIKNIEKLTRYTSLEVAKVLKKYGVEPKFKYPNDVLIGNKKIAGILAQSVIQGDILKGIVVGVGVNLNLEEFELKNIDIPATSIFNETGKKVDKDEFINSLMKLFEEDLCELDKLEGEILCY